VSRVRWTTLAVTAFVLALGALFVVAVLGDDAANHGSLLGRRAPAFELTAVEDGTPVTSESLRGRTIVVNFWNSWCIPCRQEHPALMAFYERHRDDPSFAMVGIVRDDTEEAAREYVESKQVGWTTAFDPGGAASIAYGTTGQPETYVIGPDGIVHAELFGPASLQDLEVMLDRAQGTA
jgi:cytochrome c biogenesis protein CcmG/thiol:disulfide interchange protein DsbE